MRHLSATDVANRRVTILTLHQTAGSCMQRRSCVCHEAGKVGSQYLSAAVVVCEVGMHWCASRQAFQVRQPLLVRPDQVERRDTHARHGTGRHASHCTASRRTTKVTQRYTCQSLQKNNALQGSSASPTRHFHALTCHYSAHNTQTESAPPLKLTAVAVALHGAKLADRVHHRHDVHRRLATDKGAEGVDLGEAVARLHRACILLHPWQLIAK